MPVGLLGLGVYLPERVMTNADWAARIDTSDEWILERTGIERRRIAADDESTVDFAAPAGLAALADAGLAVADVDELIVATDTPEVVVPDTAALVQDRLGLRQVPAFDLAGSGCAGFLLALDVARSRVLAKPGKRVLVIGVELISKVMDWTDRQFCVLFGDAAAAAVVGEVASPAGILAATAGTDGSRAGILAWEVGGTRTPVTPERVAAGLHHRWVMNGREVFRDAVHRMSEAAHAVLADAGHRLEDVALVVPHQANLRILNAVAKGLGLPPGKLYANVQEYGNTGSASVPLALWEARQKGLVGPGDLVLLTSFGAGLHWAAVLLRL